MILMKEKHFTCVRMQRSKSYDLRLEKLEATEWLSISQNV